MMQHLALVTVVVPDYDTAIAFYCGVMGFNLVANDELGGGKRWVVVAPPGARETRLLLARATTEAQGAAVGNQTGGRVFLFLHTDDFLRDHARLSRAGVLFEEAPREESYGKVVVFRDPFGNRWDLLQLTETQS